MAGVNIHDALTTTLTTGLDLATDTATILFGTAQQVNAPGFVTFRWSVTDPGNGTAATWRIGIQGCETSDFSTSDVCEVAWFGLVTEDLVEADIAAYGEAVYELGPIWVPHKYIRAASLLDDGTAGDFVGSTLFMEQAFFKTGVSFNDSTSNADQPSAGVKT